MSVQDILESAAESFDCPVEELSLHGDEEE